MPCGRGSPAQGFAGRREGSAGVTAGPSRCARLDVAQSGAERLPSSPVLQAQPEPKLPASTARTVLSLVQCMLQHRFEQKQMDVEHLIEVDVAGFLVDHAAW